MINISKSITTALQHHQAGRLQEAEQLYRQILHHAPTCADAWHLSGLLAHQTGHSQAALEHLERAISLESSNAVFYGSLGLVYRETGQPEQAVSSYRQLLRLQPNDADSHFVLGMVLKDMLQFDKAEVSFGRVIQLEPHAARAYYQRGDMFQKLGQWGKAASDFQQVLRIQPKNAEVFYRAGVVLWEQDSVDEALSYFEQSLQLQPKQPAACNYMGVGLAQQGHFTRAIACFQKALDMQPDYVEVYKNMGAVWGEQGEFEKAIDCFKHAIRLNSAYAEAYYNLAVTFEKMGRLDDAELNYRQLLRLNPNHVRTTNNLGILFRIRKKFKEAEIYFQKALQLDPKFAVAHYYLATLFQLQGDVETALYHFQQAVKLEPDNILWRVEMDLVCPLMMMNTVAVTHWRRRIETALNAYPPGSINLAQWQTKISGSSNVYPPLHLVYHAQNERPLREKMARLFTAPQSSLSLPQPRRPGFKGEYKTGFLVTQHHEQGLLYFVAGLINHLSQPDFKVSIICPLPSVNRIKPAITNPNVTFLPIPENLAGAAQKIKAKDYDLIYYWEAGTDTLNYLLPFFRLARVQCVSWGIPATTGIPQMDYFISSELFESEEAEEHYSERLIKLKTLGVYYKRLAVPTALKPRAYFGLSDDDPIYFCTQNLMKVHPDFDRILGDILRRDKLQGKLLLKAKNPQLKAALLERFQATIPDVLDRIRFIPPQSYSDYLNLIVVSDVLLDTIYYSGGTTSHESLILGTPIVTLPSSFMRGRMTLGCYRKMGVLDCVAANAAEYVEIAVRVASDRAFHAAIKAKIVAANHVLCEDMEAVREMEAFFRQAIEEARL